MEKQTANDSKFTQEFLLNLHDKVNNLSYSSNRNQNMNSNSNSNSNSKANFPAVSDPLKRFRRNGSDSNNHKVNDEPHDSSNTKLSAREAAQKRNFARWDGYCRGCRSLAIPKMVGGTQSKNIGRMYFVCDPCDKFLFWASPAPSEEQLSILASTVAEGKDLPEPDEVWPSKAWDPPSEPTKSLKEVSIPVRKPLAAVAKLKKQLQANDPKTADTVNDSHPDTPSTPVSTSDTHSGMDENSDSPQNLPMHQPPVNDSDTGKTEAPQSPEQIKKGKGKAKGKGKTTKQKLQDILHTDEAVRKSERKGKGQNPKYD